MGVSRAFVVIADLDVEEGERLEKELGRCAAQPLTVPALPLTRF